VPSKRSGQRTDPFGQPVEVRIADAEIGQMGGGGPEVVAVPAPTAGGGGDDPGLFLAIKVAILDVIGVDDIGQRLQGPGI